MGCLSAKKYDELISSMEKEYLTKINTSEYTEADFVELKKTLKNYFPKIGKKYGYVTFDDRTKTTEVRWHKNKPSWYKKR